MRRDLGLLLLRVSVGTTIAAHGAQKLFGWFGGPGLQGTGQVFEHGGFRPGIAHARAAAATESGSGMLLALGAATPVAGAGLAGTMVVAADLHRPKGFFNQHGGFEYPMTVGFAGVALSLAGAGRYSVDALLGGRLARPWMGAVALAAAAVGSSAIVARRHGELTRDAARAAAVEGRADDTLSPTPDEVAEAATRGGT